MVGSPLEGLAINGAIHVFHGPIAFDLDAADSDASLSSTTILQGLGTKTQVIGDNDGDGLDDLAVGTMDSLFSAGYVYVYNSPIPTSEAHASAAARIESTEGPASWCPPGKASNPACISYAAFGANIVSPGDINQPRRHPRCVDQ